MNKDIIIGEAKEYIGNNKTLGETAKVLGVSKRTLQFHFKELKTIDKELSALVESKKKENQKNGRVKGGSISKATSKYSTKQILMIAETIIKDELSYAEAALVFDIPKSTIYELVHRNIVPKEIKDALDVVGYANHKRVLVSELGSKNGK